MESREEKKVNRRHLAKRVVGSRHARTIGVIALATIAGFIFVLKVEAPKSQGIFTQTKKEEAVAEVPASFLIPVPYTVQAPFANWKVHEESCEEAALLMYHAFLTGSKVNMLDQKQTDTDLRAQKAWQIKNWGAERDLNLEKLGALARDYYGYSYSIKKNAAAEDIKGELVAGHPVLVPVLTKSLQNPHYSPGNVYHILLIKGYDATGVLTNDAGIKEGKDWHYSWGILWNAIDAQNQKMSQGRDILIISK